MLLAVSAWASQQPGQIDQEIIDWINNNAHPLKTTDPNATLDDHRFVMQQSANEKVRCRHPASATR